MMKKLLKEAVRWGVEEQMSGQLQKRIILSNQISLSILTLNLLFYYPFLLIQTRNAPDAFYTVLIGYFFLNTLVALSLYLNKRRYTSAGRLIICWGISLAASFNLAINGETDVNAVIPFCALIPPILLELKEKRSLITAYALIFFVHLLYATRTFTAVFGFLRDAIPQAPHQQTVNTTIGFIFGTVILFYLVRQNYAAENKLSGVNESLSQTLSDLQVAHQRVETQNQDITDSIRYARRIQLATLPSLDGLKPYFKDASILYLPKDLVSGDFYWFVEKGDYFIFIAADCTGHGVPGSMLSILGGNLLHSIVGEQGVVQPAEILTHLHEQTVSRLGQTEAGRSADGMDVSVCSLHLPSRKLTFASANRPLYRLRETELVEFRGDKQCIGGGPDPNRVPFSQTAIDLSPDDKLFIFSDGLTDQFGKDSASGDARPRKFGAKRLQEFLVTNRTLTAERLCARLEENLNEWRGGIEQTDDILFYCIHV